MENDNLVGDIEKELQQDDLLKKRKIIIIILYAIIILLIIGLIITMFFLIKNSKENDTTKHDQINESPFNRINKNNSDIILIPKSGKYDYILIWMHGLACTPKDDVDHFDKKDGPVPSNFKIILPCAPTAYVTKLNQNTTSWFNLLGGMEPIEEKDVVFEDLDESGNRIKRLIEDEVKNVNNDYKRIFVGGFSQGACMSYHIGLSLEHSLGGIIPFNGFPVSKTKIFDDNFDNLNVFSVFGGEDIVMKLDYVYNQVLTILSKLKNLKIEIFKNESHSLNDYELEYVKVFIKSLL
jgi:predicted esterase